MQSVGRVFGNLFWEKMARIERVALHPVAPRVPQRDGASSLGIPRLQGPVRAPEDEERADDAPPLPPIP